MRSVRKGRPVGVSTRQSPGSSVVHTSSDTSGRRSPCNPAQVNNKFSFFMSLNPVRRFNAKKCFSPQSIPRLPNQHRDEKPEAFGRG